METEKQIHATTLNEIVLGKVDYSNEVMFMFEGENITYINPVWEACGLIRAKCWNNGAMIQLDPRTEGNKKVLVRVLENNEYKFI